MTPTDGPTQGTHMSAPPRPAYYIIYFPEDFPDEESARAHFAAHWKERIEEDLGLTLAPEESAAALPEDLLTGGGAVCIHGEWRLVLRMEFFDFAAFAPGDVSPVGRQRLVRCPECGRTAHAEGHPLDLKAAHYLHWLRKDNGVGKAWKGCKVMADEPGSRLVTATFAYRRAGRRRGRSAECFYDELNKVVFRIQLPEKERHGLRERPPAEIFVTLGRGRKLRVEEAVEINFE